MDTGGIGGIYATIKRRGRVEKISVEEKAKIKTLLKFLLIDHRMSRDSMKKVVIFFKKQITVDLTATSNSDLMPVDNRYDEELFVTISPIYTGKPSIRPLADTLSFSTSTPRTSSTSTLSLSATGPVVVKRAPIEIENSPFQPITDNLYPSIIPRTVSTSAPLPIDVVPVYLSSLSVTRNPSP